LNSQRSTASRKLNPSQDIRNWIGPTITKILALISGLKGHFLAHKTLFILKMGYGKAQLSTQTSIRCLWGSKIRTLAAR